uniref:Uncharacterized protein n=1 Tax=Oryza nivara TaxID=4536 RepID=A0A0E0I7W2_ORYNI
MRAAREHAWPPTSPPSSHRMPPLDLPHQSFASQTLAPSCSPRRDDSIFPLSPLSYPLHQATITTSFAAEEKLFYLPFRPPLLTPSLGDHFPGCALSGNTLGRRRRGRSTIGAPAPLLSFSLLLHGKKKRRKKKTGGRRREKEKKRISLTEHHGRRLARDN